MEEDINFIWEKINCEACYKESINYCKEKCKYKCKNFKTLENLIDIINNSVSIDKVKELISKIDDKANRVAETYKYSDSGEELARKKAQVRHYEYFIKELEELLEGDE